MEKLQKIGASILWALGLCIFLAQTYRAVAYYIIDLNIDVSWKDLAIAGFAFAAMFVHAELKTMVVDALKSLLSKLIKK